MSDAPGYCPPRISTRLREHARREGAGRVAWRCARWALGYATGLPRVAFGRGRSFRFEAREYRAVNALHNWTWLNERSVELPIARSAVEERQGQRVLEVGNVLSHYFPCDHVVIDKYEQGPGVINADALEFEGQDPWDLIVSVSTIEHIGRDERPRDPQAAERAIRHLAGLLSPGGKLLATIPAGYNPELDAAIQDGRLGLTRLTALRRFGRRNVWREVPVETALDAPYDFLLYAARSLIVLTIEHPSSPDQHITA